MRAGGRAVYALSLLLFSALYPGAPAAAHPEPGSSAMVERRTVQTARGGEGAAVGPVRPSGRRAVVVVMAGVGWEEFSRSLDRDRLPLSAREEELAWALLNVRGPGKSPVEEAYVALGAGARTASSPCAGEAFEKGEGREPLYRAMTGWDLPSGAIFHPCVSALRKSQEGLDHSLLLGLLGESLRRGGKKAAVVGNADFVLPPAFHPDEPGLQPARYLVASAMDFRGSVPLGAVGQEVLLEDPRFPGGVRTDYEALVRETEQLLAEADLILVETGDFLRLDLWRDYLSPVAWEERRRETFGRLFFLLGRLFGLLRPEKDLLLLLSLSPGTPERKEGFYLTPLVAWGWGGGLLTSPTTQSRGIVSEADILPSLLQHLEVQPVASLYYGKPVERLALEGGAARRELDGLAARLKKIHLLRRPFIKFYVGAGVALVLGGWLLPSGWRSRVFLSYAALPLATLLLALSPWLLLPWPLFLLRPGPPSFFFLSLLTSLVLGAHALLGSPLESFTLIGHSPVSGARYYGLGNEYLGAFLGATFFALCWLAERRDPGAAGVTAPGFPRSVLALLAVPWLLTVPLAGANYGGAAAAAMGVGALLWVAAARLRPAALGALGAGVVFLLLLFSLGRETHASLLLDLVRSQGWGIFAETVARKAEMNWRLMLLTRWSWLLLAFCGIFFLLLLKQRRFVPLGLSALGLFLLNDSGVVAASLALSFPASFYLSFPAHWNSGPPTPPDGGAVLRSGLP